MGVAMLASAVFGQSLAELESQAAKAGPNDYLAPLLRVEKVEALVTRDELKTADEFYRASKLVESWMADYRTNRLRYELLLTALGLGHDKATTELPDAWDSLMIGLGRPLRFDRHHMAKQPLAAYEVAFAPKAIRDVYFNASKRREAAAKASDSKEIKAIMDADQADRQKDFSKLTQADIENMVRNDRERLKSIESIVSRGRLTTPSDFASASLVMQHSAGFAGYRLAHELAVSSVMLGENDLGRWLVAATYDRMLNSVGHDQRFGTQYFGMGHRRTDEAGFNDRQRKVFRCPSLAEARARVIQ